MTQTPPITTDEQPDVRRLTRTREERWFGGVCAGLGRYFDVSPTVYRLVFAALALVGGTGLLLYLAAWLVIPDESEEASIAERALRERRDNPLLLTGVALIAVAALVLASHAVFWPHGGGFWLAALIVGGALVWWELHGRAPRAVTAPPGEPAEAPGGTVAAPRPGKPSLFLPVVGALLAAAGVAGVLEAVDVWSVDWAIFLGAAVAFVGVAIVAGAFTGWRVAGLVGVGLLLVPALALALAIDVPLQGGLGDRVEHPRTASAIASPYRLAVGDLRLDLGDVRASAAPVRATVGIGQLRVVVPSEATVEVDAGANMGEVVLFGEDVGGLGVDRHVTSGAGEPDLVLDLDVGIGRVEVLRG